MLYVPAFGLANVNVAEPLTRVLGGRDSAPSVTDTLPVAVDGETLTVIVPFCGYVTVGALTLVVVAAGFTTSVPVAELVSKLPWTA